jgi:hypothetical protein
MLSMAMFAGKAQAGVFFDFVCADPTCNGSPNFSWEIEFDPLVVSANNSFTGADNGIFGMTIMSGVGDGFTLTLADLKDYGGVNNDRSNLKITFDATATQVQGFEDADPSASIIAPDFGGSIGVVRMIEGTNFNYFITEIEDFSPVNVSDGTDIRGRFVRRAIPEPGTLALFGLGLAGLGFARRRRAA